MYCSKGHIPQGLQEGHYPRCSSRTEGHPPRYMRQELVEIRQRNAWVVVVLAVPRMSNERSGPRFLIVSRVGRDCPRSTSSSSVRPSQFLAELASPHFLEFRSDCSFPGRYAGGTSDSQKEFVDSLSHDVSGSRGRPEERRSDTQPPLANKYAVGYTYHDVLDADHEGTTSFMKKIAREISYVHI